MATPAAELSFERVTDAYIAQLCLTMRTADVEEMRAAGFTPKDGLLYARKASSIAMAVLFRGKVAAMVGAIPSPEEGVADMWMVSSHEVTKRKRLFLKASLMTLPVFLNFYAELRATVDARYQAALRWVRWLGFEVADAAPWGPQSLPHHQIRLRRTPWAL